MGGCSTYGVWTRWLDSDYRVTWCDIYWLGFDLSNSMTKPVESTCMKLSRWTIAVMRSMPFCRPDHLLPWLIDRNIWPDIPNRKIKRYWNHMKNVGSEIGDVSPAGDHHPIWIWGDAANYAKDHNIITICIGSVLDDRTDSITKCFPIALCREEPCLLDSIFHPVYPQNKYLIWLIYFFFMLSIRS